MDPDEPWHYEAYYENIEYWDDERLVDTYERLSRDLRMADRKDDEHFDRMGEVERELRERGFDTDAIARSVEADVQSFK